MARPFRRLLLLLLPFLSLGTRADAPVSIRLTRLVYMVGTGQSIGIYCIVPRHADNRRLWWGIQNYTSSERQLDGADSPKFFGPFLFQHLDCDVGAAFCELARADGHHEIVVQPFEVAGCDDPQ
jgi:hypothetical protein